jgi:2-keto-4-pentenoate hydratase/2-oxohepta-3-ene-1,7-dioic acid hydratase in catechol pathway
MRIVRFKAQGKIRYGVLEGPQVVEYAGTPYTVFRRGRKRYPVRQVVLLPPVTPSKIVCVGVNYRDDAGAARAPLPTELLMVLKPPSALCGPDDPVVVPPESGRVEYGAELAVVIRRRCRRVAPEHARDHVLGYTCLNDVTARDIQQRDGHATRAKAFDTFCPVGPCVATDIDPNAAELEVYRNGERTHAASTKRLIFPVEDVVAHVSSVMTLLPGDVIATGTPAGAGPMEPGDKIEVRIDGIGSLKNPVIRL